MKDVLLEKYEDECDIECFNKAYSKYLKDPATFSSDEVKNILKKQALKQIKKEL